MQTIKTKASEIVLVEMFTADIAKQVSNNMRKGIYNYSIIRDYEMQKDDKLLGFLSDISEKQAEEIVEKEILVDSEDYGDYFYKNYNGDVTFISALESLKSLIESKGLNPDKTVIILKKESKK